LIEQVIKECSVPSSPSTINGEGSQLRLFQTGSTGLKSGEPTGRNTNSMPSSCACDRGSRLITASQTTSSHSLSERSNVDDNYCGNQEEKRSNTSSEQRCEINKVLHKSVPTQTTSIDDEERVSGRLKRWSGTSNSLSQSEKIIRWIMIISIMTPQDCWIRN